MKGSNEEYQKLYEGWEYLKIAWEGKFLADLFMHVG